MSGIFLFAGIATELQGIKDFLCVGVFSFYNNSMKLACLHTHSTKEARHRQINHLRWICLFIYLPIYPFCQNYNVNNRATPILTHQ